MNLLGAAGLGLGLGAVTGLPLGVVNVAVADAASTHKRHAIGIGLGGALADSVHALLAFAGVGRLVTERPDLVRILAVVAAIAIVGYAVLAWRRHRGRRTKREVARAADTGATDEARPADARATAAAHVTNAPLVPPTAAAHADGGHLPVATDATHPPNRELSLARGIPAGLALTLPNPGALTAWVAIAAALWPRAEVGEAIALAAGVGVGSALWFALLAHLVARLRPDHVVLRRLPVVALVVFVVIAVSGVVRAL